MRYPLRHFKDREDIFGYLKKKEIYDLLGLKPEKGEVCWLNYCYFCVYKTLPEGADADDFYYVKIISEYVAEWKTYYATEKVIIV